MPEIGTYGSMSGDGKRGDAAWPKLPRPSSTLPFRPLSAGIVRGRTVMCVNLIGTGTRWQRGNKLVDLPRATSCAGVQAIPCELVTHPTGTPKVARLRSPQSGFGHSVSKGKVWLLRAIAMPGG